MNITGYSLFIKNALKYGFSLFGLPKTGQIISYSANDDGAYQKGYPKTGARFVDNGDGTVTDNATGLMWVKEPGDHYLSFSDAIAYCENLDFAGHTDWRLPNIKELLSLTDASMSEQFYNPVFTLPIVVIAWSSTTYIDNPVQAIGFNFQSFSTPKLTKTAASYFSWAVRQG